MAESLTLITIIAYTENQYPNTKQIAAKLLHIRGLTRVGRVVSCLYESIHSTP